VATGTEPSKEPPVDPSPCVAAVSANDDERIVAACGALIDNEKTASADRLKALLARAPVLVRKGEIDRAIADYDAALQLDATLADVFNTRGELEWKRGDRRKALADFAAAIRLNPGQAAARDNHKALALELERLGAMMAIYGKPSFNCAAAKRPVEKAICADPELANLDREINAVHTRAVRAATADAGRSLQREQDAYLARRSAAFGRADYDLQKDMRARLDRLLSIEKR
jgi:tetratricopeptide (TPR) repeat protein